MNAIELKNIKKTYKIYKKPLHRLSDVFFKTNKHEEFHALKDITLTVPVGETVGVLGKNGAGKSTLLKILTGVTQPTSGDVFIQGSIAAILELNSGFDTELTGRENIVLKCTIMGYTKEKIEENFDSIIEFADIGKYIDQPVRTYSSGMKARLGFAIAVNSNPDILIVDEALSVGDEVFRTKCLKKMSDFRKAGKTIFFVSHSIFTIKSFCTKAAWIKDGELMDYGDMSDVTRKYEVFLKEEKAKEAKEKGKKDLERKDYIGISDFKFKDTNIFEYGEDISYSLHYLVKKDLGQLRWTFTIRDIDDKQIYTSDKQNSKYNIDSTLGEHSLDVLLKEIKLLPGKYKLSGEVRDESGIVYVGYANKKVFEITSNEEVSGFGIIYIDHELKR